MTILKKINGITVVSGTIQNSADSITYSNTTSGLTATNVQGAIDELATDVVSANDVTYSNTTSGLTATDVQGAIDEVKADISAPDSITLTQTETIFKSGTGKNKSNVDVDVSSSLIEGQISAGLKGNTITGLSAVGDRKMESVGKNLFDYSHHFRTRADIVGSVNVKGSIIKLKPNTTYVASTNIPQTTSGSSSVFAMDSISTAVSSFNGVHTSLSRTVTTLADGIVKIGIRTIGDGSQVVPTFSDFETGTYWVQLEEGDTATDYEPYTQSTQYINAGGVLSSLPNGVKDEVHLTTSGGGNKLQMVSEAVVINGASNWLVQSTGTNTYQLYLSSWAALNNAKQTTANSGIALSDDGSYPIRGWQGFDVRLIAFEVNHLFVRVEKAKVDAQPQSTHLDRFKSYLNQFPITLIYQLASNLVKPVQVEGQLIAYPNGTIHTLPYHKKPHVYDTGLTFERALLSIDKVIDKNGAEVSSTDVTLAANGLTATISGAASTDAFVVYGEIRPELSTAPETTLTYPLNTKAVVEGLIGASQKNASDIITINDTLAIIIVLNS